MEIQPASFAQLCHGRDGRRVWIDEDVGDVAKQLSEIDEKLRLQWNEKGKFFMVVEVVDEGPQQGVRERLIFTAQECDGRIVERMRKIASPSYDFLAEIDRLDAQADREKDHAFHEQTGEVGEVLAHALRKDLEHKGKIFLPREVTRGR